MPYGEYDMGMTSFRTRKQTGADNVDMIKYRRMIAEGHPVDQQYTRRSCQSLKRSSGPSGREDRT
jgi:hypothetical protein